MINKLKKYHRDYEQFSNSFSNLMDIGRNEYEQYSIHFYYPYKMIESRMSDNEFIDFFISKSKSEIHSFIVYDTYIKVCGTYGK